MGSVIIHQALSKVPLWKSWWSNCRQKKNSFHMSSLSNSLVRLFGQGLDQTLCSGTQVVQWDIDQTSKLLLWNIDKGIKCGGFCVCYYCCYYSCSNSLYTISINFILIGFRFSNCFNHLGSIARLIIRTIDNSFFFLNIFGSSSMCNISLLNFPVYWFFCSRFQQLLSITSMKAIKKSCKNSLRLV